MRSVPDDFDRQVVAAIDARLDEVERDHHARILLAVESGSRAWGFGSPDSDYDVRFLYVRRVDQYLSPWIRRDVIETPLDPVLDVNGWDAGKALKLLLKGNAVAVEWLTSPIVYRGDLAAHRALTSFAVRHVDRAGLTRHYRHLGERQYRTYCSDEEVALKKVFYALRPAIALRWLRHHPDRPLPPMHFPTLVAESDVPPTILAFVDRLLALKSQTHEMGAAPLPSHLRALIEAEFARAGSEHEKPLASAVADAVSEAESLFRHVVLGGSENPLAVRHASLNHTVQGH